MKNPKYSGGTTVTQGMLPAPPPLLQLSLRQANLPVLELRPSPGPWSANGTKVDPIPNPPPKKKKTRGTVLFFGVWEIWKFSGLTRLVCKFDSLNVPRILGASEFLQGFCFLALKKTHGFFVGANDPPTGPSVLWPVCSGRPRPCKLHGAAKWPAPRQRR